MSSHNAIIDIDVPVRVAYNQFTQFEQFPKFMEGVESITQVTNGHLRWKVEISGVSREFTSKITEQEPDQRIAWCSLDGPNTAGVATFHKLDDNQCRVSLQMEFDPEGFLEQIADKAGFVTHRVEGDLKRFKAFIEERGGVETGAHRGSIKQQTL